MCKNIAAFYYSKITPAFIAVPLLPYLPTCYSYHGYTNNPRSSGNFLGIPRLAIGALDCTVSAGKLPSKHLFQKQPIRFIVHFKHTLFVAVFIVDNDGVNVFCFCRDSSGNADRPKQSPPPTMPRASAEDIDLADSWSRTS